MADSIALALFRSGSLIALLNLRFLSALLLSYEPRGACIMTTQTKRGRAQDRARVAGGQDHEVRYEAEKEGVSRGEVKDAIKQVGNSRKKVEAKLEG
jgi:Protein of unknown function (DUF3606).